MTPNPGRVAALVLTAAFAGAAVAAAQSYGGALQTLTIGAAAFEAEPPILAGNDKIGPDGYLYGQVLTADWWAPVLLTDGAWIDSMCVYYRDNVTGLFSVSFGLVALAAEGQTPTIGGFGYVPSTHDDGYQFRCVGINKRLRDMVDPVGGGTLKPAAFRLRASATGAIGLGAVLIRWRREVSPSPDVPTFGDVPTSDSAFPFVEALAASGITSGCGGGKFCPNAPLTRRQMAVFLAKALGLHWPE